MNKKAENTPGIVYGNYIPIIGTWKTPEERVVWYKEQGIDITKVEVRSLNSELTFDENGNCYY